MIMVIVDRTNKTIAEISIIARDLRAASRGTITMREAIEAARAIVNRTEAA